MRRKILTIWWVSCILSVESCSKAERNCGDFESRCRQAPAFSGKNNIFLRHKERVRRKGKALSSPELYYTAPINGGGESRLQVSWIFRNTHRWARDLMASTLHPRHNFRDQSASHRIEANFKDFTWLSSSPSPPFILLRSRFHSRPSYANLLFPSFLLRGSSRWLFPPDIHDSCVCIDYVSFYSLYTNASEPY